MTKKCRVCHFGVNFRAVKAGSIGLCTFDSLYETVPGEGICLHFKPNVFVEPHFKSEEESPVEAPDR